MKIIMVYIFFIRIRQYDMIFFVSLVFVFQLLNTQSPQKNKKIKHRNDHTNQINNEE